jgi:hypothetical protein
LGHLRGLSLRERGVRRDEPNGGILAQRILWLFARATTR